MPQRRNTRWIWIVTLIALGAGALALPGVRARLRANHALYLRKAGRYEDALREFEALAAAAPGVRARMPGFATQTMRAATDYFVRADHAPTPLERRQFDSLLDFAAQHPDLAPDARRARLRDLTIRGDGATSATLAAARAILNQDGFDEDALWALVRLGYDPEKPLAIPAELIHSDPSLQEAPAPGAFHDWSQGRRELLGALVEISRGDWAGAADRFDRLELEPGAQSWRDDYRIPHGLALLRAGRPEAAATILEERQRTRRPSREAQGLLLGAWLAARDYPEAAAAYGYFEALFPREALAGLGEAAGMNVDTGKIRIPAGPILDLAARALPVRGPLDWRLWEFTTMIADPDHPELDQELLGRRAAECETSHPLTIQDRALLLQYGLRVARHTSTGVIERLMDPPPRGAAVAGREQEALDHIEQWFSGGAEATGAALTSLSLGRMMARAETTTFTLRIPAMATMAVLLVQANAAPQTPRVWPIVSLDLGPCGQQLFYAVDAHERPIPLILPLNNDGIQDMRVGGSISFLNPSDPPGGGRSLLLNELLVF